MPDKPAEKPVFVANAVRRVETLTLSFGLAIGGECYDLLTAGFPVLDIASFLDMPSEHVEQYLSVYEGINNDGQNSISALRETLTSR